MNPHDEVYLIYGGAPVKSLPGGKVSGRIVTFSGAHDPDRAGEFFTAATDFWLSGAGDRRPILYRHGVDKAVKKRRFGEVQITRAADGLWVTGHLDGRDSHTQKMLALAEQGKLNWSTGATGHLCDTTPVGSAKHIDSWPIAECSLCPLDMVAEPRNILSIKSLPYDVPDFDSLVVDNHQTELNRRGDALAQSYYEQRAAEIYAQTLKWADETKAQAELDQRAEVALQRFDNMLADCEYQRLQRMIG